ncbi:unnamed protein product [Mycena citricolor]|uniref:Uncharacterized protein n=1 Tax=Mycena citricolor TaxID=2018698 RepID=A0AAD2K8P6_9AGAR|nr:unnamed protein product [Mycena citricolor]
MDSSSRFPGRRSLDTSSSRCTQPPALRSSPLVSRSTYQRQLTPGSSSRPRRPCSVLARDGSRRSRLTRCTSHAPPQIHIHRLACLKLSTSVLCSGAYLSSSRIGPLHANLSVDWFLLCSLDWEHHHLTHYPWRPQSMSAASLTQRSPASAAAVRQSMPPTVRPSRPLASLRPS